MRVKKNTYALIAIIMNAIEMGILILFGLAFFAMKNSSDFATILDETLAEQGMSLSALGLTYNELMNGFLLVVGIMIIYSIVKFIFNLLGYLRNNPTMTLVAAILTTVSAATVLFTFNVFIIAFEVIVAVLLYFAYGGIKKVNNTPNDNTNNSYTTNRPEEQDKTIIDIEL